MSRLIICTIQAPIWIKLESFPPLLRAVSNLSTLPGIVIRFPFHQRLKVLSEGLQILANGEASSSLLRTGSSHLSTLRLDARLEQVAGPGPAPETGESAKSSRLNFYQPSIDNCGAATISLSIGRLSENNLMFMFA